MTEIIIILVILVIGIFHIRYLVEISDEAIEDKDGNIIGYKKSNLE